MQTEFASEGRHLEDAEQFVKQISCEERGDFAGVVRRGDFDEIAADDVQSAQCANELKDLDAGEAPYLRRSCAGGVGRINDVDIKSDVNALAAKRAQMTLNARQTPLVKLLGGDHPDFVSACKIEIIFAIDLTAKANLQHAAFQKETLFKRAAERRAVRILAAEILVPQIIVGVELDQRNGAVFFCDGTKDG